jgi:hypothetical protein
VSRVRIRVSTGSLHLHTWAPRSGHDTPPPTSIDPTDTIEPVCITKGAVHTVYREEGSTLAAQTSKCPCVTKNRIKYGYGFQPGWLARLIESS